MKLPLLIRPQTTTNIIQKALVSLTKQEKIMQKLIAVFTSYTTEIKDWLIRSLKIYNGIFKTLIFYFERLVNNTNISL